MEAETLPLATFTRKAGHTQADFVRNFDHSVETVWAAMTAPDKLPLWLAPGEIELRKGGAARLDFVDSGIVINSTVSACEPPRLLEFSWSSPGEPLRPVRLALEPEGAGARLSLTLGIPDGEDVARSCAGWEAHLEMLAAVLEGVAIKFPFERFKATREAYKAQLAG